MRSEMHLDDYLDAAIKAQGLTSDRDLGRRLGFASTPVTQWRTKRTWPSDENMVAIAKLARIDPARALIDLNIWRAKSPETRTQYQHLLEKVTACILIVFIALSLLAPPAFAGERSGYKSACAFPEINIMRY